MDRIIIAVDGISYAGKTTLCHSLKGDYHIVEETPAFGNYVFEYADTPEKIIRNAEATLNIERMRTQHIIQSSDHLFLLDRSVFSYIAISYAYLKTNLCDYFHCFKRRIIESIGSGDILLPDYIVHLQICQHELLRREAADPPISEPYWTSSEFNAAIDKALGRFAMLYDEDNRSLQVSDLLRKDTQMFSKYPHPTKILNELFHWRPDIGTDD